MLAKWHHLLPQSDICFLMRPHAQCWGVLWPCIDIFCKLSDPDEALSKEITSQVIREANKSMEKAIKQYSKRYGREKHSWFTPTQAAQFAKFDANLRIKKSFVQRYRIVHLHWVPGDLNIVMQWRSAWSRPSLVKLPYTGMKIISRSQWSPKDLKGWN